MSQRNMNAKQKAYRLVESWYDEIKLPNDCPCMACGSICQNNEGLAKKYAKKVANEVIDAKIIDSFWQEVLEKIDTVSL